MQALVSVNLRPRGGSAKETYFGASFVWQQKVNVKDWSCCK